MHAQPLTVMLLLTLLVLSGSAGVAWDWWRRRLQADLQQRSAAALLGHAERGRWSTHPEQTLGQVVERPRLGTLSTEVATKSPSWKETGRPVLTPIGIPAAVDNSSTPHRSSEADLRLPLAAPPPTNRETNPPAAATIEAVATVPREESTSLPTPPTDVPDARVGALQQPSHLPEWMTVREICYETRLSPTFVRKQLWAGELAFAVFGSRMRVRRTDYQAWVARSFRAR